MIISFHDLKRKNPPLRLTSMQLIRRIAVEAITQTRAGRSPIQGKIGPFAN
jgi:hypothetical protein